MRADPAYYQRPTSIASDGTPTFSTAGDTAGEDEVAAILGEAWHCTLRRFGHLAAIDFFGERHGRVVSLVEIKTRSHASTQYPTVYLNLRKWLALTLASIGLGVPAFFVVRFDDGLRFVNVAVLEIGNTHIGGCSRRVKSASDIEPVIEVPVAGMRAVKP